MAYISILFTLESFFPHNKGGTEIYVYNLAKQLQSNGFDVNILITTTNPEIENYIYDEIPVYCLLIDKEPDVAELNGLKPPKNISQFKNIIQQINPDIIHFHSFGRGINSRHLQTAASLGIKTVFTAHLGGVFCINGNLLYKGKRQCDGKIRKHACMSCYLMAKRKYPMFLADLFAFEINFWRLFKIQQIIPSANVIGFKKSEMDILRNYCNKTVAIANWIAEMFYINGNHNIKIIKQGIDTSKFARSNKSRGSNLFEFQVKTPETAEIHIAFVGRLNYSKGVHLLIDAFKKIDNQKVELTIITVKNDIDYYNSIRQSIENSNNVHWFENLKQEEVNSILDDCDILCLPAISNEAAPLVILEAFAKGIPVIGSSYIAIREMIQHEHNGLIFESNNVDSLKNTLQRLIDEPDLLNKLRQNISPPRSFKDVAHDHIEMYRNLSQP